jgi:hypothetical protein
MQRKLTESLNAISFEVSEKRPSAAERKRKKRGESKPSC